MPENETIFKPRYRWYNLVALYITWPVGMIGFIFAVISVLHNPGLPNIWFSILIWAVASLFPPLVYIRAIHFGKQMVVRRYFLSDWVIKYEDITSFDRMGLIDAGKTVILSLLTPESFAELDQIIKPYIKHTVGQRANYK